MDAPFHDYQMSAAVDGDEVTIKITTSGCGRAKVAFKAVNLDCEDFEKEVALGEEIVVKGRIVDGKQPYYGLVIPEGDLSQILEVYGR